MSTVHVLTGLPGSGKTTHSFRLVDASEKPMVRVSLDDIRDMLGIEPGRATRAQEGLAKLMEDAMVREAVRRGHDVVVDNCNLTWSGPLRLKKSVRGLDVIFVVHDFTMLPLQRCIARDAKRTGYDPVGSEVIRRLYGSMQRARTVGWTLTNEWMNDPSAPIPSREKS